MASPTFDHPSNRSLNMDALASTVPCPKPSGIAAARRPRLDPWLGPAERLLDFIAVVSALSLADRLDQALKSGRQAGSSHPTALLAHIAFACFFVLLLERHGEYRPYASLLWVRETERLLRVTLQSFVVAALVAYCAAAALSRLVFILAAATVPALLTIEKAGTHKAIRRLRSTGYGTRKALILGTGSLGRQIFSALARSPQFGLDPLGFVDDDPQEWGREIYECSYQRKSPARVLAGSLSPELLRRAGATVLVIAVQDMDQNAILSIADRFSAEGISTYFVPAEAFRPGVRIEYAEIDGITLGHTSEESARTVYETGKRMLDIALSALLLGLLAPLFALLALMVKLTSPGPVIFCQNRVGRDGRVFPMYKFRSMFVEAATYAYSPQADEGSENHSHRALSAAHQLGRIAPVVERAGGGHVTRRPSARNAIHCGGVFAAGPGTADRQTWNDRSMAIERGPRLPHPSEHRVRPLLRPAPQSLPGRGDPAAHPDLRGEGYFLGSPPLRQRNSFMRIAVIGSGYVGLVSALCLAEIGHYVVSVDIDASKVSQLERGEVPIHERWLPELLQRHTGRRLKFSSSLAMAMRAAQAVFITVGTPQSESGEADLSNVEAVVSQIAPAIQGPMLIVEKSTVPVCTCDSIRKSLVLNGAPRAYISVASNPEFLREGTAVTDFLYPDRIVIGADDSFGSSLLRDIYRPLTEGGYYRQKDAIPNPGPPRSCAQLIATSARSAELIKHASNSFLAMKISFLNMVANVAEAVGADIDQVCVGLGTDTRIGPRFLHAGIGYGGSCFPKDIAAFHAVASQCGVDASLLTKVAQINREQQRRFVQKVRSALWTLRGKRVGILGLAFKGGTDDTRESPAIAIVRELLKEGVSLCAYDPAAMPNAQKIFPPGVLEYAGDPYRAAAGRDALLILTDWNDFARLDLQKLRSVMRLPIILDGGICTALKHCRPPAFSTTAWDARRRLAKIWR